MKKFIVIFCIFVSMFGCQKEEYLTGIFDGVTYSNTYFGFTMKYSSGYEVYQDELLEQMLNVTLNELEDNGVVYEYMVADVDQMPIFQFYVEHYKFTTSLTYDDFVAQVVQQFASYKDVDVTVSGASDIEVNGVALKKIPLRYSAGSYTVNEDIYMINKNNYVGTLIVTYVDDQKEEVEEIIQSIQLLE